MATAKRDLTNPPVQGPQPTEPGPQLVAVEPPEASTRTGRRDREASPASRNGQRTVAVMVPERAPNLTPDAARALLRLLRSMQGERSHK